MAVTESTLKRILQTKMNYGVVSGEVIRKTKSYPTFGKVKDDAVKQNIVDTANAIAQMQEPTLENTYVSVLTELEEE